MTFTLQKPIGNTKSEMALTKALEEDCAEEQTNISQAESSGENTVTNVHVSIENIINGVNVCLPLFGATFRSNLNTPTEELQEVLDRFKSIVSDVIPETLGTEQYTVQQILILRGLILNLMATAVAYDRTEELTSDKIIELINTVATDDDLYAQMGLGEEHYETFKSIRLNLQLNLALTLSKAVIDKQELEKCVSKIWHFITEDFIGTITEDLSEKECLAIFISIQRPLCELLNSVVERSLIKQKMWNAAEMQVEEQEFNDELIRTFKVNVREVVSAINALETGAC